MLDLPLLRKIRRLTNTADHTTALALKALSDVNRYRIFCILSEHPKLSVSDLATILNISTPLASMHLKVLFHARLIRKEKSGKNVYPQLEVTNPFVRAFVKLIVLSSR